MKKMVIFGVMFLFLGAAWNAGAVDCYPGDERTIFSAQAIAGSGSASYIINTSERCGYGAIQWTFTGAGGVMDITYQVSNDGTNFYAPDGMSNALVTGAAVGGGYKYFKPAMAKYFKIIFTETAGNPIALTAIQVFR